VQAEHGSRASGAALILVPETGLARALGRVVESAGLTPLFVSAAEAAALVDREKPVIALVDLDGDEAPLAACRNLRRESQLPILAITSSPRLPSGCREAGVTDFVTKPIDRELLATRIAFHLEAPAAPRSGAEVERRLQRLESAQALAGIGYWEWDIESDEVRLGPGAAAVLQLRDPLPTQLADLLDACVEVSDQARFVAGLRDAVAGEPLLDGLLSRQPHASEPRFFKHFVSANRAALAAERLITVTVRDVTNERRAEEGARRIAFFDSLTGLPNRRLFEKRLAAALRRFEAQLDAVALLFLDLDGFKQVNDRFGHAAGDEVLRIVGQRLLECTRAGDEIARVDAQASISRFGGDEFAVLLTGLRDPEDAAECARRVHASLSAPIEIDGAETRIGASVGIAIYPRDGTNPEMLLSAADAAMYAAKSDASAIYAFYHADLHAGPARKRLMIEQLNGAEARGELSLLWQPKFDLATGRITGAEALARWQNPLLGSVLPSDFVPVAEETGLILKIGQWVLEAACHEAGRWSEGMIDPPAVAVNVSRVQLVHGDLERVVYDALMRSALDPRRLELEITESLMIEGENAIAPLRDLGAIGLTLALDDFGSGYSTLASLVRFPVNTLKLDRALIRDIDSNPDAARVVRAVIRMAHDLGRRVVAEGVDNHAALRFLREFDCDEAQGFLLAKPMTAHEFRNLLASWRPSEAVARWR